MGKKKIFVKTDLTTPIIDFTRGASGAIVIPLEIIPPAITAIDFGDVRGGVAKQFQFTPWYGLGIDPIVYSCQRQIERFLDKQDSDVETTTISTYCHSGLSGFFEYLSMLSRALDRRLTLNEINREMMDGYLGYLDDRDTKTTHQKTAYHATKAVLKALCQRGLVAEIVAGEDATFPPNPFPGAHRKTNGEQPLPKAQRNAFSVAIKTDVMPIFSDAIEPTSETLAYALLIIALHTGRNTSPLLEMARDCLRAHPKDDTLFLVLYKRRGHSTSKVAIRADRERDLGIESLPTVRPTVARLVKRVIELSSRLREQAPEPLRDSVWLYRMRNPGRGRGGVGVITALNEDTLARSIKLLVGRHKLLDTDGNPLRVNISRLRKTFVNRIYEILEGDLAATAMAAGNSVDTTAISYLRPGEDAQKNWKFMGVAFVQELLTNTIGATERTPVGQCSDNRNGEFAPKSNQAACMSFLNCLRCRNYVVTSDDLYRLYSFYWRILSERAKMDSNRWRRQFSHIVRLIDRDVIAPGIAKGIFKQEAVDLERERARRDPHPYWRIDSIIGDLAGSSA